VSRRGPDDKASGRLVYSDDRALIVRLARERGMDDTRILSALVQNEYGDKGRRKIIEEWAKELGLSADQALKLAVRAGLIAR
jgi:hypothetical protein